MKKLYAHLFFALLFFATATSLHAQIYKKESNYWYFGTRGGLRFLPPGPTGGPVPLTDAANDLNAGEGSTAISDTAGNLLMYCANNTADITVPSVVWNKRHIIMPNGTGIIGNSSSTQNAIIVRRPGSFTEYYIFSVAQLENYGTTRGNGFYYTKIDMTLDGGLGDVVTTEKNVLIADSTTEKVSAVLHRNKRDVWVVSHRWHTNEFVAVLVTDAGVQAPVYSAIGLRHAYTNTQGTLNTNGARGALKISPNGNRIACAITDAFANYPGGSKYVVQLGRFNNATGKVSNVINLLHPGGTGFGPFGLEFSSNNSYLYVGYRTFPGTIQRWDLCQGEDSASIVRTKTELPGWTSGTPGCLQLGLDNNIYVSRVGGSIISRIDNHTERNASATINAITLPTGRTVA